MTRPVLKYKPVKKEKPESNRKVLDESTKKAIAFWLYHNKGDHKGAAFEFGWSYNTIRKVFDEYLKWVPAWK